MTPKANYSAPEEKSSASDSSVAVVEHVPFDCSFEQLSAWLDGRLESLESEFVRFRTAKSFSASLGR